jgi:hypothetical protein
MKPFLVLVCFTVTWAAVVLGLPQVIRIGAIFTGKVIELDYRSSEKSFSLTRFS